MPEKILAERLSDGRLTADVLSTLPDELMAELTAIPGIGPWTVQGALIILSRSSEKTSSYQATSRSAKPGMAAPSGEYHQRYLEKHGRASCAVTIR